MVTWVNIPHNSRIILIRNFEKIFYILTWKTVRYFSMIGERTIGKYCPVRRMCWLHLYNPENFLIKSRQPVAQPVKIARAQLRSMQNIFSLKILNCSPMCWSLALAIKDWIHKSFFIRAIFSISTGFYCKICFITPNWVKVQFRLINEAFSDTDPVLAAGRTTSHHSASSSSSSEASNEMSLFSLWSSAKGSY